MNSDIVVRKKRTFFLINRNYALLWLGQSISNAGDLFFDTTLTLWIATQLAKGQSWAPLAVSGVSLAASLPTLLIGPFAGVFVDRWNKRATMMRMDLLRALLIGLLLLLAIFVHQLPLPLVLGLIYIICALTSVLSQFFNPSRMGLIKDIVPAEYLAQASSLSNITLNIALIVGPTLAAPLYFAFGAFWAIALNALSFLASWLALLAMRVASPEVVAGEQNMSKERNAFRVELLEGLRFYRRTRVLMVVLLAGILFNLGAGASNALYILFVLQNLHTPQNLVGLFAALYGVGVIAGSLLAVFYVPILKETRVFWLALLGWGLCSILFACLTNFVAGLIVFLLQGFCNAGIVVVIGPLRLRATPRELIGRVEAVLMPTIIAAQVLSMLVAGSLASGWLAGLHFVWLGVPFNALAIIFIAVGCMGVFAGVYAKVALRGVVLKEQ